MYPTDLNCCIHLMLVLVCIIFMVIGCVRTSVRTRISPNNLLCLGPWHYLKIISGRIWLAWKLVRHPRVLNVFDTTSKKYEKVGLVATELEEIWEMPHELKNREVLGQSQSKIDFI